MNPPLAPPARRAVALVAALVLMLGVLSTVRPVVETANANTSGEGQFVPLSNIKLLDTKTGYGTSDGQAQQVPANGTLTFPVLGKAGIASSGVSAVSLALTVVKPGATGKLSVFPSDTPTTISTVSFSVGETATGADFTQIASTGQVTLSNQSSSPVDVQIAVNGYFQTADATAANAVYKPVTTAVLWDSRLNVGTPGRILPLFAGEEVEVQVAGQTGIPADCTQATAVALNIAAFFYSEDGDVLIHPSDSPPGEPVLQYVRTDPESSAFTIAKLSCTGKLKVKNTGTGTVHLSISVRGYFTTWTGDDSSTRFKAIQPATLLDTATGAGVLDGSTAKLGPEQSLVFMATDPSGIPASSVAAAALTLNVTQPTQNGYLSVRPADAVERWISTLHYQAGEDATGFDTATPSSLGEIVVTNHSWGTVNVNITTPGYFVLGQPSPVGKEEAALHIMMDPVAGEQTPPTEVQNAITDLETSAPMVEGTGDPLTAEEESFLNSGDAGTASLTGSTTAESNNVSAAAKKYYVMKCSYGNQHWSDSNGTLYMRNNCKYDVFNWGYKISAPVQAIITGKVNERGARWWRNGHSMKANAPHPAVDKNYWFHGTFKPAKNGDLIQSQDYMTFRVRIKGRTGTGSIVWWGEAVASDS